MLVAGLMPSALAQSGNSIPYFQGSTLFIPRIDVEGYGSLQLALTLKDAANLTFSIENAVTADAAMTPGATFNLTSFALSIPVLKVGTEFYQAQLQLVPGDRYCQVKSPELLESVDEHI